MRVHAWLLPYLWGNVHQGDVCEVLIWTAVQLASWLVQMRSRLPPHPSARQDYLMLICAP